MKKWYLIPLVVVMAVALLLAGCSTSSTTTPPTSSTSVTTPPTSSTQPPTSSTSTPPTSSTSTSTTTQPGAQPYGTITIASSLTSGFTYESFDPNFWETFWGDLIFNRLVNWDAQGNVIGELADSWTLSPDGLTWTFKIHQGVTFSNGDPLTSKDVKFSLDRFASADADNTTSTNPWSPYFNNNFGSTSTPDDYTFVFVTQRPEPSLIVAFTYLRILPMNYFNKVGQDTFRTNPIGSGPYTFVKLVHNTSCTFTANPTYWGSPKPAYKDVVDLLVPEEATRVALLKSGDVDMATNLSLDREVELQKEGYRLQQIGPPTLANINFPGTWETTSPTGDIRVRQAMSFSLNRQEMSDTFYDGLATPGGEWFIDQNGYGWDPGLAADPYDPAKAAELLKEANYPAAFANPVITCYAQAGAQSDLMQLCKGYWDAAGIQTKIVIVDAATYAGMFFTGARAPDGPNIGTVIPWIYGSFPDSIYHSANMYTSHGVHATGNDPKADELYNKALHDLDPVQAKADYTAFRLYGKSMYVDVGVVQWPTYAAVGPNLGKFNTYSAIGIYFLIAGIEHPTQ